MLRLRHISPAPVFALCCAAALGQFREDFEGEIIAMDPTARNGWACYAGDGEATIDLQAGPGFATVAVDATNDRRNIWWAVIRRCVSADMNLSQLADPDHELRVEARIRISHAPRRVNLHFNTQRTTDFHSHLMEFDIPTAGDWHTISMTTRGFDAVQGDDVFAQMALMDWGRQQYRVDVDYVRAEIINVSSAEPDQGVAVPYHPPVPSLAAFSHTRPVDHAAVIDAGNPDTNLNDWTTFDGGRDTRVLAVNGTQTIILRWNLDDLAARSVDGSGLLELTTHSLQLPGTKEKDSGLIRVVEILGGDPDWEQGTVTFHNFCRGTSLDAVLNSQMIIDVEVSEVRGGRTLATISNPVLQRLIDGRSKGLAILPLGSIHASFFCSGGTNGGRAPKLHLNVRDD